MAPAEESDSGLESLSASSKDLTPEKPMASAIEEFDDEDEVRQTNYIAYIQTPNSNVFLSG